MTTFAVPATPQRPALQSRSRLLPVSCQCCFCLCKRYLDCNNTGKPVLVVPYSTHRRCTVKLLNGIDCHENRSIVGDIVFDDLGRDSAHTDAKWHRSFFKGVHENSGLLKFFKKRLVCGSRLLYQHYFFITGILASLLARWLFPIMVDQV